MVVKFSQLSLSHPRGFGVFPSASINNSRGRKGGRAFPKRVELLLVPVFHCFGTVISGKNNVQLQLVATNLNGGRLNLYVNRSGVMGCVVESSLIIVKQVLNQ